MNCSTGSMRASSSARSSCSRPIFPALQSFISAAASSIIRCFRRCCICSAILRGAVCRVLRRWHPERYRHRSRRRNVSKEAMLVSNVDPSASRSLTGNRTTPRALVALADEALLEAVQRQTFRFFWEGAHPASALALDRRPRSARGPDDPVAVGGSGFGLMALIVAVERGWVGRAEALDR